MIIDQPADQQLLLNEIGHSQADAVSDEDHEFLAVAEEVALIGIWKLDLVTRKLNWSAGMYRLFGINPADFNGDLEQAINLCVHPDDRALVHAANRKGLQEGASVPLSYRILLPDGSQRIVWAEGRLVAGQAGQHSMLMGYVQDITQRVQAEAALRESEEKYRLLFENMVLGVVFQAANGQIIDANRAALDILGLTMDQIQGRTSTDPRWKAIHEDGSDFPGETHPAMQTLQTGQPVRDMVMGVYQPLADSYHWINVSAEPRFKPGATRPFQVFTTFEDITERKRTERELRQTLDELRSSNAELEQFAYVASHDLQEPLRVISGMAQLLQKRYQGRIDPRADEYIQHAVEAALRMQALITDLLTFSRIERRVKLRVPVCADAALRIALQNLSYSIIESRAQITHDPLPVVASDPTQLAQVFQNLVGNAIKFCANLPPQIHVGVKQIPEAYQFSVSDNGIGIEPRQFERIFQVFQRLHTRDEYPGTGIGLAMCKKIVERHGGHIWVESLPGQGSTFYFTIPIRSLSDGSSNCL